VQPEPEVATAPSTTAVEASQPVGAVEDIAQTAPEDNETEEFLPSASQEAAEQAADAVVLELPMEDSDDEALFGEPSDSPAESWAAENAWLEDEVATSEDHTASEDVVLARVIADEIVEDEEENLFADLTTSESDPAWEDMSEEDSQQSEEVEAVFEDEAFEDDETLEDDGPSFAKAVRRLPDAVEDVSEDQFMSSYDDEDEVADEDIAALFQVEDTSPEVAKDSGQDDADAVVEETAAPATSSIASKLQRIRSVVAASVSGLGGNSNAAAANDMPESDDLTDDLTYALSAEEEQDTALANNEFISAADLEADEDSASDEGFDDFEYEDSDAPGAFDRSFEDELAEIEHDLDDSETSRRKVALELSDEDLIAAAAMARPRNAPRPKAFERTLEAEAESEAEVDETVKADGEKDKLLSDLAAIEHEMAQADSIDEDAQNEAADAEAAQARRVRAQESLGEDSNGGNDETVERLLSQTNSKLNDDHTQRRQSALAHLKAAVAATIADRVSPKDSDERVETNAAVDDYRKDLASIVRPKAVERAEQKAEPEIVAEDAETADIEPLVLVPQARVEPDAAVRPRRIDRNARAETAREQSTGFADYADEMGANELHDLLEAAAAYLSTVEGKPHFSRPEVMHMVMRHDRDRTFSREAQLRSFGDLLRNGTIEKVDRGQFVISNDSRYVANG
jgi:hypothetical protein